MPQAGAAQAQDNANYRNGANGTLHEAVMHCIRAYEHARVDQPDIGYYISEINRLLSSGPNRGFIQTQSTCGYSHLMDIVGHGYKILRAVPKRADHLTGLLYQQFKNNLMDHYPEDWFYLLTHPTYKRLTPLSQLIANGSVDLLISYLEDLVDVCIQNGLERKKEFLLNTQTNDSTYLNSALKTDHFEIIQQLMNKITLAEFSPADIKKYLLNPCHIKSAILTGNLQVIEFLWAKIIAYHPTNQELLDLLTSNSGSQPIHLALKTQNNHIILFVLNKMLDVYQQSDLTQKKLLLDTWLTRTLSNSSGQNQVRLNLIEFVFIHQDLQSFINLLNDFNILSDEHLQFLLAPSEINPIPSIANILNFIEQHGPDVDAFKEKLDILFEKLKAVALPIDTLKDFLYNKCDGSNSLVRAATIALNSSIFINYFDLLKSSDIFLDHELKTMLLSQENSNIIHGALQSGQRHTVKKVFSWLSDYCSISETRTLLKHINSQQYSVWMSAIESKKLKYIKTFYEQLSTLFSDDLPQLKQILLYKNEYNLSALDVALFSGNQTTFKKVYEMMERQISREDLQNLMTNDSNTLLSVLSSNNLALLTEYLSCVDQTRDLRAHIMFIDSSTNKTSLTCAVQTRDPQILKTYFEFVLRHFNDAILSTPENISNYIEWLNTSDEYSKNPINHLLEKPPEQSSQHYLSCIEIVFEHLHRLNRLADDAKLSLFNLLTHPDNEVYQPFNRVLLSNVFDAIVLFMTSIKLYAPSHLAYLNSVLLQIKEDGKPLNHKGYTPWHDVCRASTNDIPNKYIEEIQLTAPLAQRSTNETIKNFFLAEIGSKKNSLYMVIEENLAFIRNYFELLIRFRQQEILSSDDIIHLFFPHPCNKNNPTVLHVAVRTQSTNELMFILVMLLHLLPENTIKNKLLKQEKNCTKLIAHYVQAGQPKSSNQEQGNYYKLLMICGFLGKFIPRNKDALLEQLIGSQYVNRDLDETERDRMYNCIHKIKKQVSNTQPSFDYLQDLTNDFNQARQTLRFR